MQYDALILDLDGVVYIGPDAVEHAIASLNAAASAGVRLAAATNNANRPASEVARHLQELGLRIDASDVMTSAQAAAEFLARELESGTEVLAVGGEGVAVSLLAVGLQPIRSSADMATANAVADRARAVVVGYGPLVAWYDLAAAHWAIERGARWIATNTDATVPLQFGRAPGNGAIVGLLQRSTGRKPEVIGKPQPRLFQELVRRSAAERALVVGDRLDTDIDGAISAGLDSLLVCTGVHGPADLEERDFTAWPTYVARDLRSLHSGTVRVELDAGRVVADSDDPLTRAVVAAANARLGVRAPGAPGASRDGERGSELDASPLIDVSRLQKPVTR